MDGIDLLALGGFDGKAVRHKDELSAIVGALLSEQDEQRLAGILGHGVKSKWYEGDGNKAIEILGNLLGGTDAGQLAMTMDLEIISAANNVEFYVDDTSLIVYDIFKSTISPWSTLWRELDSVWARPNAGGCTHKVYMCSGRGVGYLAGGSG